MRTFPPEPAHLWRVDVICGGFPCTDISSSGKKDGIEGEHSALWWEMHRIVRHLRPRFVVVENVSDLTVRGIGDVLGSLAALGFDAEWEGLPAAAFGAPQRRFRSFIVAHPRRRRREGGEERDGERPFFEGWNHDDGLALAQRRARQALSHVRRMADGLPDGTHRLKALGNAVYPDVAEWIGRRLIEAASV